MEFDPEMSCTAVKHVTAANAKHRNVSVLVLHRVRIYSTKDCTLLLISRFLLLLLPLLIPQLLSIAAVCHWDSTCSVYSGVLLLDQTITVLAKTGMFVSGLTAFLLDNTIPGYSLYILSLIHI